MPHQLKETSGTSGNSMKLLITEDYIKVMCRDVVLTIKVPVESSIEFKVQRIGYKS
jgi:hypothetical protein